MVRLVRTHFTVKSLSFQTSVSMSVTQNKRTLVRGDGLLAIADKPSPKVTLSPSPPLLTDRADSTQTMLAQSPLSFRIFCQHTSSPPRPVFAATDQHAAEASPCAGP